MSFPNVLVIGQMDFDMGFDQLHLGLARLANVRTTWDRMVNIFTAKKPANFLVSPLKLYPKDLYVQPDFIFIMDSFRKIQGLNSFKCPKAFYIQDPHVSTKRYLNFSHLEDFDFVFCRQKDYLKEFEGSIWLPESFDLDIILGQDTPIPPTLYGLRDIPITFIGHKNASEERAKMISMLQEKFGLQNPFAYNHEMASILRRSKIIFNHTRNGDLNNRVFDALGSGALLMMQRIGNGLLDLFKEGEHLITYGNIEELEYFTKRLLSDDSTRLNIAKQGQKEALEKHTNLDRAKTVLETCLGKNEAVEERWRYLKQGMK